MSNFATLPVSIMHGWMHPSWIIFYACILQPLCSVNPGPSGSGSVTQAPISVRPFINCVYCILNPMNGSTRSLGWPHYWVDH